MAHETIDVFYYPPSLGPVRDGVHSHKCEIRPTLIGLANLYDMLAMADDVIEWGLLRWQSDHGSYEDHQRLVNFVNLSIAYMKRYDISSENM